MSAHFVTMTDRPDGAKDFKKVQPTPAQEAQIATLKAEFEKSFGVDQVTRTPEQWRNLVRVYGMEAVCKTEKIKEKEVKKKMRG